MPRWTVGCSEAVGPTFLPLLCVTVMKNIDRRQRPYRGSPSDFSTGSSDCFSRQAFIRGILPAFFFKPMLGKRNTPLPGLDKQQIIEWDSEKGRTIVNSMHQKRWLHSDNFTKIPFSFDTAAWGCHWVLKQQSDYYIILHNAPSHRAQGSSQVWKQKTFLGG